jgi:hypothetical protein
VSHGQERKTKSAGQLITRVFDLERIWYAFAQVLYWPNG